LPSQLEFDRRDIPRVVAALVAAAKQAIFALVPAALGLLALILTVAEVQTVGAAIVPGCFGNRGLSCRGTKSSNPSPSSGESPANLSFRRIEVQGRSREADGDSRGGEHQGCAAVQQLTASPAADATESNVSLARPEPLYECAADGPKEDFGDMANGESRTGRQCGVGRQRGNDKEPSTDRISGVIPWTCCRRRQPKLSSVSARILARACNRPE
jgi:hypothetical protein